MPNLHWNTVNDLLRELLETLMVTPEFNAFRLVGGTSLSLQLGHRISVDIDLFTDEPYDSIDFAAIDHFLRSHYQYVATNGGQVGGGTSYYIGNNEDEAIKLDLYYVDEFIQPVMEEDGIRLATVEEIIAMKLDVISESGRKKDFWDLHALIDDYSLQEMVQLHEARYPYTHDEELIGANMTNFTDADDDLDPVCLERKLWEIVKYDIAHWANT